MNATAKSDGTVGKALEMLDLVAEFGRPVRFTDILAKSPHPKATAYRLLQTLTNQHMLEFNEGDELIKQGEASRDLYFLEEGDVSVYLRPAAGEMVRIRRTGPGTVLGELGFYLNTPRTASVIADGPGKAYRLSTDALSRMENTHPVLAAALHRFMADLLAERLLRTTHTLEAVLG